MTRDNQKQIVEDMTGEIAGDIMMAIDEGKVPEEWGGVELRWLVKDMVDCYLGLLTINLRQ